MIRSDRKLSFIYASTDFMILTGVFTGFHVFFKGFTFLENHLLYLTTIMLTWFFITSRNKVYYVNLHTSLKKRFRNDIKSHAEFMGAIALFFLVFNIPSGYTKPQFMAIMLSFPVIDLTLNYILYKAVIRLRINGKNVRRTIIVGAGRVGRQLEDYFEENPDLGYKVVGFLDDEAAQSEDSRVLGTITDFDAVQKIHRANEVIIAIPTHLDEKIQFIADRADFHGMRIRMIPDYFRLLGRSYKTNNFGEMPVINIREVSLDKFRYALLKRCCDVAFSSFVLLMLAPLFIVLGILIKLESRGPVFYFPTRLGKGGKPFRVYKFRSMYQNDASGTKSTTKDDPRITRIGKYIRKFNLDELPQFLNVLLGDMSVVGPRPHRVLLNEVMQNEVDHYMVRHYLKPGITGWAQVNGWRGPTETKEQRDNRTACDLWYVENWTPLLDMKIIYLTVFGEKTYKAAF
ncbi:MAG: undecaprenyl-phosphate glucose phosphotransferase [Chitinophagaceae bacterium]